MPARVVAKTKGLAAAPVFDLFAVKRSYSSRSETNQIQSNMQRVKANLTVLLLGTIMPMIKTPPT